MRLLVKKLQGGECTIEVQPSTLVFEIKRIVAKELKIPIEEQKLLFLGRTLVDEQTLDSYPKIKDGSKLNLIVKKPEGLYEVVFKAFKKSGMSDLEAKNTTEKFMASIQENLNKMSWDDIERLATDCLEELDKPLIEVDHRAM